MSDETKTPASNEEVPLRPGEVRLRPALQVTVPHTAEAAPAPENKTIHPRRPLPTIPDKTEEKTSGNSQPPDE